MYLVPDVNVRHFNKIRQISQASNALFKKKPLLQNRKVFVGVHCLGVGFVGVVSATGVTHLSHPSQSGFCIIPIE